jgi:hypothetical protein
MTGAVALPRVGQTRGRGGRFKIATASSLNIASSRRLDSSLKERGLVKPVPVWGLLFFLLFRPLFGRARRGGGVKDRPEADRVAAEGP